MAAVSQTQPASSEPTQGKRSYPRTFGGLIGSMIVAVIVIVAYWALQNATHTRPTYKSEPVEYLQTVKYAQEGGYTLVYPTELPQGAYASAIRFAPGTQPTWGLSILDADGEYIGIQHEDAYLDELIDTYVDKGAKKGKDATFDSPIATTWTTWSDKGGDHAFAAEMDGTRVLVFGSAPVEELKSVVEALSIEPVTQSQPK